MAEAIQSRTAILWVISAVQFLTPFMFSAIGVALPAIGREFNAGAVQLGLIEMVYILAVALLLLPVGRFSDIHGRKRIFLSGTCLITLATLLLATAPTVHFLIAFRFLQGVGAAMITSTSFAILTSVFPHEERGKAMGVVVGCVYLGISAGPTLAGLMIDFLGWRWIFYCSVVVELFILGFAMTRLKGEWADAAGQKFDWLGSLFYILALFAIIVGLLNLQQLPAAKYLAFGGILLMTAFFYYETNIVFPILPIAKIVSNRIFALSSIATWLNYSASFGIMFFFSLYLQIIKGFPPKTTGFILIIQPILQAICAPIAGRMADKYSPAPIATMGMVSCTLGLLLASFLTQASPMIMVYSVLVVMGLGFGFFSTPNTTAIMASVDQSDFGLASSIIATMRTTGMLTAMTLITILLSMFLGSAPVSIETADDYIKTMRTAMIIFTILGCIGVLCSLQRTQTR